MKIKMLKFLAASLTILVSLFGVCLALPVNEAAKGRDSEAVKKFIGDSVPAINEKDKYDWTALHYAAVRGNFKTVGYLLEQGADVNAKGNAEYTPLIVTAIFDQYEMAKYLVEHGADLNAKVRVAEWFKSRTREDNSVETVKIGEEYATALDFAANTTLRKDAIAQILKMRRQDYLQGNSRSLDDALLIAELLRNDNKDNRMADYLKSKGAYSIYKPGRPVSGGVPTMKIFFSIILITVIIGISPLIIRAVRMAVLKYQLKRSRNAVVIITSPDKEGAKVTIAYPPGTSPETREAVKQTIERSPKIRSQTS